MNKLFRITLAADMEAPERFRSFVNSSLARVGLDSSLSIDMALAVSEACRIISVYGYANLEPGSIELTLSVDSDLIRADLFDFGHPFEPVNKLLEDDDPATVEIELPPVFRRLSRIDYRVEQFGNHLIMVKRVEPSDEAVDASVDRSSDG
jgi:anti-sigma regulatory factor (Ser/Thr protein kinase)